MEPLNPLPVQTGQRFTVLRHGPASRPRTGPFARRRPPARRPHAAGNLRHSAIAREAVGSFDIFVARQPPMDRLPDQSVAAMGSLLTQMAFAQCAVREIAEPGRIIEFAPYQETAIRNERRAHLTPAAHGERRPPVPRASTPTLWVRHVARMHLSTRPARIHALDAFPGLNVGAVHSLTSKRIGRRREDWRFDTNTTYARVL